MKIGPALLLTLALAPLAQAATITVTGVSTLGVNDHGVTGVESDPTALGGGGSFAPSAAQGRGSVSAQLNMVVGPDGFLLDVQSLSGVVVPGSTAVEVTSNGQLVFTTSGPTPYSFSGNLVGSADGPSIYFLLSAGLRDEPFTSYVYSESDSAPALSFNELLGDNPATGSASGVLPAGTWRVLWDQRVNNLGVDGATLSGALRLEVGVVPEPSSWALLGSALLLICLWRRP